AFWIWFATSGKIFRVNAIVDRKIFFHVREKDRDVDDVLPRRAGVFQHKPNIFKHRAALRFDIVTDYVASGIKRHTGDILPAAYTRADSGEKQKFADALRVRKRPH